jgi:tRNA A-37 threonylcarbamoyl transferase component Bud32/DNA-binding NarL/FixJ family response regulator
MSDDAKTVKIKLPERPATPPPSAPPLKILIVHDDLAIRLRLADLLSPHCPAAVIDSCTLPDALEMQAKLRAYAAAIVIVDFAAAPSAGAALAAVGAMRAIARSMSITVLGRGGHERSAVEALRAGAIDYWSLHHVDAAVLVDTLRAHFLSTSASAAATTSFTASVTATDVGPLIAGYKLLKELARSPRATLYLANSEELGKQVAIKVHGHRERSEASDSEQERFLRECRLLSQLNHHAIADVFDFGVTDECHWLAMEYFPAGSLKARLRHPIAEPEAIAYIVQVGGALRVIHAAAIVHRDLKPSNIMLRADNSLALIDFGLARPALTDSDLTSPNVRVGSPAYMAPEQVQGVPPDERCDLYSLGIVFYELLTGELPFNAPTIGAILEMQMKSLPPPLPAKLARYQPVLDGLLAKRPIQRFTSADQFLEALAVASGHVPMRRNA